MFHTNVPYSTVYLIFSECCCFLMCSTLHSCFPFSRRFYPKRLTIGDIGYCTQQDTCTVWGPLMWSCPLHIQISGVAPEDELVSLMGVCLLTLSHKCCCDPVCSMSGFTAEELLSLVRVWNMVLRNSVLLWVFIS